VVEGNTYETLVKWSVCLVEPYLCWRKDHVVNAYGTVELYLRMFLKLHALAVLNQRKDPSFSMDGSLDLQKRKIRCPYRLLWRSSRSQVSITTVLLAFSLTEVFSCVGYTVSSAGIANTDGTASELTWRI